MDSIVIELQRNVLNPDIDVITLLRQAFLIAKKLKLIEFEDWINSELNGYKSQESVPLYRKITGQLKAYNPFHGWVPVMIEDTKVENIIKSRIICDPITNIMSATKGGTLTIPLSGAMQFELNKLTSMPDIRFTVFISHNQIDSIIESVKNKILEWAIVLEENGIIGTGLTFSKDEKERAIQTPQIVNYITTFSGNVENSQIQQGTNSSKQLQTDALRDEEQI